MSEALSQAEIDALMTAAAPDASDATPASALVPAAASGESRVRLALRAIQGVPERFAARFAATLSRELGRECHVRFDGISIARYGTVAAGFPLPSSFVEAEARSARTGDGFARFLFVTSGSLAFSLVDAYYGGGTRAASIFDGKMRSGADGRDRFTAVDRQVIGKLTDLALADLSTAGRGILPVTLSRVRDAVAPRFPGPIGAAETVAAARFEVTWDGVSAPIAVVFPGQPAGA